MSMSMDYLGGCAHYARSLGGIDHGGVLVGGPGRPRDRGASGEHRGSPNTGFEPKVSEAPVALTIRPRNRERKTGPKTASRFEWSLGSQK